MNYNLNKILLTSLNFDFHDLIFIFMWNKSFLYTTFVSERTKSFKKKVEYFIFKIIVPISSDLIDRKHHNNHDLSKKSIHMVYTLYTILRSFFFFNNYD